MKKLLIIFVLFIICAVITAVVWAGLDAAGGKVINVADPTAEQDAATKIWVETQITDANGTTQEAVQDWIWNSIGTTTLITLTYDDGNNEIDFVVDEASIDHDALTNFVSGEHFLQSAITQVGTIATGVWEGTDVGLAHGGTGASLSDPGADRIMFWDDGAGAVTWLVPNTNISISGTNLNVDDAFLINSGNDTMSGVLTNDGLTITTGNALTLGATRWDNGSDKIDGEQIADDTIDDDSIDLSTGAGLSGSDMPNEDLGDISVSSGSWTLDNDVVNTDEMGDGDYGDFTFSSGSATLDANVVAASELAPADYGDVTIDNAGAITIDADSVALTTDTTGNYAAGDGEAGNALTGDSATSFFSSGTIEHERGGLKADVSAYSGLVKISGGSTSAVTDSSSNWNTAFGWGDHDSLYLAIDHDACDVTSAKITEWDNAYGWGDHSLVGYLENIVEDTDPCLGGDLDGQQTYSIDHIVDINIGGDFTAGGDITAGDNFYASVGAAGSPSYSFIGYPTSGMYYVSSSVAIAHLSNLVAKFASGTDIDFYYPLDMHTLNISGVDRIYVGLGSEALPSRTFTGHTDTGWWLGAGGTMRASHDANEILEIKSTGINLNNYAITYATNTNWDAAYDHISNNGTDHSLLGATAGTATASLALIVDADKNIDFDGGSGTFGSVSAATTSYFMGSGFPVVQIQRKVNVINAKRSAFRLLSTTAQDMADGFGGGFIFAIEDNAAVINNIAGFYGLMDGGDTSGKLAFDTWSGGTQTTKMVIASDGGVFMYNLKADVNQVAAGAATNELWVDTDADYVIKLGQ